jgi:hypothetical protein
MIGVGNADALMEATQRRSASARRRVDAAIELLVRRGEVISPTSVARAAGVSRQWLYTDPARLGLIRQHQVDGVAPTQPDRPASSPSQMRRIEALLDDNRRLRARVESLEGRLATLYGELRMRQSHNS